MISSHYYLPAPLKKAENMAVTVTFQMLEREKTVRIFRNALLTPLGSILNLRKRK